MAATVAINQYWGAAQSKQVTIRHDWLSADVAQDSDKRTANPITRPGAGFAYSFEVWQKLEITVLGGAVSIGVFRIYVAAVPTGFTAKANALAGTPSNTTAYLTPVGTLRDPNIAANNIPETDPGVAAITGTLTQVNQESTFLVTQLVVGTSVTGGFDRTFNWVYEEIV